MTRPPLRVGVAYDFRNPPESGMSHADFYAAIIEQAAWLDGLARDQSLEGTWVSGISISGNGGTVTFSSTSDITSVAQSGRAEAVKQ